MVASRSALSTRFLQPPVASRQPQRGTGKGFPETPSVASRSAHETSNPQSLRDSPRGARGKDSPKPLRSLRAPRTKPLTPSRSATAPEGHGERIPRNPFGRFAPNDVIFLGVSFVILLCSFPGGGSRRRRTCPLGRGHSGCPRRCTSGGLARTSRRWTSTPSCRRRPVL